MTCTALPECPPRCGAPRAAVPRKGLRARTSAVVVATAIVLLMLYGEAWLLQRTHDAPDELTVATCALDAVASDAGRASVCLQ